jgi:hypothetical protein
LRDPSEEPFRAWASYRRKSDVHDFSTSNFLYSPYQLLEARGLRRLMRYMRRYGLRERGERFRLVLPRWRPPIEQIPHRQNRRLIALSAIDHWYRPDVMHRIYGRDDWYAARRAMDPGQLLAWIGLQPSEIREFAERLLSEASFIDPLGDWHEVIRQGRREWWSKLKGDAPIASDQRVAAEILLIFYEDLAERGLADPLPDSEEHKIHHPLDDRVARRQSNLDETLTRFGLSPYPSLVLVLEGDVEALVVPRVMEMLGIPQERSFIDVHNARSVDRDFGLLASYIPRPGLGRELPQGPILLDRPATRFLLTADPEGANMFLNRVSQVRFLPGAPNSDLTCADATLDRGREGPSEAREGS